jgi:cation diffusion facilitator CzcD-associated flavoprotein CzcO
LEEFVGVAGTAGAAGSSHHRPLWDGAGLTVHTDGGTFRAAQVVVATAPFRNPVIPATADALGPDTVQLQSSAYRNPE